MNQVGHTRAKKKIFLCIHFFLSYFSAWLLRSLLSSTRVHFGAAQGRFLGAVMGVPIRGPWGRQSRKHQVLIFLGLKDIVVLHRPQTLVTACSCMKKHLWSLQLLKRFSCGMCNSPAPPTIGEVGFLTLRNACCTGSVE